MQLFKKLHGDDRISRPDRFIKRWAARDTTVAAPKPGRPAKVPIATGRKLAAIADKGWKDPFGTVRGYSSVAKAIRASPRFAALAVPTGAKPRAIRAAMRRAVPTFGFRRQVVKPALTEAQKKQRRKAARELGRGGRVMRRATVFIDEASWGPEEFHKRVVGDTAKGARVVSDSRAARTNDERSMFHFAVAVGYGTGAIHIWFLNGSKGTPRKAYKERIHSPALQRVLQWRRGRSGRTYRRATAAAQTCCRCRQPT